MVQYLVGMLPTGIRSVYLKLRVRIWFCTGVVTKKSELLHYQDQLINAILGNNRFYFENHTELISALCERNAELLIVKAGGTYSYH
jgi:hypothetical protein